MSDMDDLINAVLCGQDVTHIGQEYRSRARMIQVDPSIGQNDGSWTGWELSKKQEAMMSLRPHKPDPERNSQTMAAIDKATDELAKNGFPSWPTLPRGY